MAFRHLGKSFSGCLMVIVLLLAVPFPYHSGTAEDPDEEESPLQVFELKGGTSLSKGYGIIQRFSEDVGIRIEPNNPDVKTGKNQNKTAHCESRKHFYDRLQERSGDFCLNYLI